MAEHVAQRGTAQLLGIFFGSQSGDERVVHRPLATGDTFAALHYDDRQNRRRKHTETKVAQLITLLFGYG